MTFFVRNVFVFAFTFIEAASSCRNFYCGQYDNPKNDRYDRYGLREMINTQDEKSPKGGDNWEKGFNPNKNKHKQSKGSHVSPAEGIK